ncbi:MAG: MFS transporter [Burkholderiales bacterium]|jgi:MFS family permease|nr:MFS transporter [Burkholderiales bacterium]
MSAAEIRASTALAAIFALRMLGLFLILPVFAVHARGMPGGDDAMLVGIALGIYGLTQGVLQIPMGAASDRYGRKQVIVAGLSVFALGSIIAALAGDILWVIVGRALQGAGAISAAVTAFIADSTRDEHRTKAMALVGASIGLTFAVSLVAAPVLYAAIGLGGLFWMTALLALAGIAVVLWLVPPAPARTENGEAAHWKSVALDSQLLRLNAGIFTLHAVQMAMFVVVPVLLVELGLPLPQHWKIYLPAVLASFVLMMPPILMAERRGRLRLLLLAAGALMVAVQLGLRWLAPSVAMLAFWLLLFFVAFNILEASFPSLTSRLAPASSRGLALGIYNTTQSVGLAVGAAVGGWLAQHFGSGSVFLFAALAMAAWVPMALGMREVPARTRRSGVAMADGAG